MTNRITVQKICLLGTLKELQPPTLVLLALPRKGHASDRVAAADILVWALPLEHIMTFPIRQLVGVEL